MPKLPFIASGLNKAYSLTAERRSPSRSSDGLEEGLGDFAAAGPTTNQPPPCTYPHLVRFQLPTPFYGRGQDGDLFGILDNHAEYPAEPGKVKICMETSVTVTSWKQLDVVDCRGDLLSRDWTQDGKHETVVWTYNTGDVGGASLLLWKAKFLSIHTPMYQMRHLEKADGLSWKVYWGGD